MPTFLGVHTLALSEELTLDGGALRVWTGAAEHHDPTADSATQLLAEQQRYRRSQPPSRSQLQQAGGAFGDGSLEARADQVFCSPPASGRRVLGGPVGLVRVMARARVRARARARVRVRPRVRV